MGMEEAEFKEIGDDEPAAPPSPEPPPSPAAKSGAAPRAGALPRRTSVGQRYQATAQKPPGKAARTIKAILIFGLPILIAAIVAAGFIVKSRGGAPVWIALLRDKLGILPRPEKPKKVEKPLSEMDQKYNNALAIRFRAQFYVKTVVRRAEETPETFAAVTPEKAEEIVKELTEWLEKMTTSIDDVVAVADETNKEEGTRQSDVDNIQAKEEVQNHTKFRKELAGILADWKVHRDRKKGIVAGPPKPVEPPKEPPKPVEPPKEPPRLEVPKRPHPWASFKPGAWVRSKVTVKGGDAPKEALLDQSLSEVTETIAKVKVEEAGKEGSVLSSVAPHEISDPSVKAVAAEKLKVGEVEVACVVLESSPLPGVSSKAWIALEGPAARLGEVKTDTGRNVLSASLIEEETRTIGEREVKCLKIYREGKSGDAPLRQQVWFSEQVPGFVVRQVVTEGEGVEQKVSSFEVVDFGDDVSRKPALAAKKEEPKPEAPKPEAPKPEAPKPLEKTPAELLAEADKAYADATTLFLEVRKAMASPPEEAEAAKALLAKVEAALGLFVKAKETYGALKDKAQDPAAVEQRAGRIDKALPLLKSYADGLESKLK